MTIFQISEFEKDAIMSTAQPIQKADLLPESGQPLSESRDERIARYGSPEFTQALTEAFHRAKRLGIQADREAADRNQTVKGQVTS